MFEKWMMADLTMDFDGNDTQGLFITRSGLLLLTLSPNRNFTDLLGEDSQGRSWGDAGGCGGCGGG